MSLFFENVEFDDQLHPPFSPTPWKAGRLYSPNCRQEVFSETELPVYGVLEKRVRNRSA
jgi:hypothetical protein